jgi:hypothetical protein
VARAYRIVGMLGERAKVLETEALPRVQAFLDNWRRRVCWLDGTVFGFLLACFLGLTLWAGYWKGFSLQLPYMERVMANPWGKWSLMALLAALVCLYPFSGSKVCRRGQVVRKVLAGINEKESHENYVRAFKKNTCWWRSIFRRKPAGWGRRNKARLAKLTSDANGYVQKLNDVYANPAGKTLEKDPSPEGLQERPRGVFRESRGTFEYSQLRPVCRRWVVTVMKGVTQFTG